MKKVMTIIAMALTLVSLAAVLSGCASAQAAQEKIIIAPKAAPLPEDTPTIVLGLGNGKTTEGSAQQAPVAAKEVTKQDLELELACAAATNTVGNTAVLSEATTQPAQNYKVLQQGMESEEVRALQEKLSDLGYLDTVTGYYGTDTQAAVAAFQESCGLEADGIAGTETQMNVFSDTAE